MIEQFKDEQNQLYKKIEALEQQTQNPKKLVYPPDHRDFDSFDFDAGKFISNVDNRLNDILTLDGDLQSGELYFALTSIFLYSSAESPLNPSTVLFLSETTNFCRRQHSKFRYP